MNLNSRSKSLMYNSTMEQLLPFEPVDYLVIGHLSTDMVADGFRLGGTAAFSALTARALGMRTGVVTAWAGDLPSDQLNGIIVHSIPTDQNTTFENVYTTSTKTDLGRTQYLHRLAPRINLQDVPMGWRKSPIIHLGPIAQELDSNLPGDFSPALLALTPQGWMRSWDENGLVTPSRWEGAETVLSAAGAVVISLEDVDGDEDEIERLSLATRVLAVTEGPAGARLYWHNDLRRFRAPLKKEMDATGAGDIFAAAFFIRLLATRDPWESARFATQLAAYSVTRSGLDGIPRSEEIKSSLLEVF